jgi:O-antigen ligase
MTLPVAAPTSTADEAAAGTRRDLPVYLLLILTGIALQVFSGNSDRLGFPIGPDRLCLGLGLVLLLLDPAAWRTGRLRVAPVHLVLFFLLAYATLNALAAGTLRDSTGFYGLVDRFGAMPFLMFFLAPLLFGTPHRRNLLLITLTGLGVYLGLTAVLEGLGLDALVWPGYINDPFIGSHFGRARGPFLEAVANGLVMVICGIAAGMGLALWRSRSAKAVAVLTMLLCAAGSVFTLTRAVWLAALVAPVLAFAVVPRLRRWALPALAAGAAGVLLLLLLVPSLSQSAGDRLGERRSADDRRNANAAAVRALAVHPVTGIGWSTFESVQRDWVRQAEDYPITSTGIGVHNVPLSHATELGVPAAVVWTATLATVVLLPLRRRGPTRELQVWQVGLLCTAAAFGCVAMLGPLSYALPNLLLWLFAGILWSARAHERTDGR